MWSFVFLLVPWEGCAFCLLHSRREKRGNCSSTEYFPLSTLGRLRLSEERRGGLLFDRVLSSLYIGKSAPFACYTPEERRGGIALRQSTFLLVPREGCAFCLLHSLDLQFHLLDRRIQARFLTDARFSINSIFNNSSCMYVNDIFYVDDIKV